MIDCVDSIVSPETTRQPIPAAVLRAPSLLAYSFGNSWPTYYPYAKARPDLAAKGWIISTTLSCLGHARCYDIEPGGGQNRNIGIFMRNADRRHGLPILYTFAANGPAMLAAARTLGFKQGRDFYYLSSHVGRGRHICSPHSCGYPQADGTQWAFEGDIDRSILSDYMLPSHPTPPPKPVRRASGSFKAELTYDHDHTTVGIRPLPGHVNTWGDIDEMIHLDVALEVGPRHPGRWSGWVSGASAN